MNEIVKFLSGREWVFYL